MKKIVWVVILGLVLGLVSSVALAQPQPQFEKLNKLTLPLWFI